MTLNGSFEEFYALPQNFTEVKNKNSEVIPKWMFLATPDYFNRLNRNRIVGIPNNFAGQVIPKHGRACVGIILRSDPLNYTLSPKYSEHIQNELCDTLSRGQLYCMKMYVSLADKSGIACDGLGVYFSQNRIAFKYKDDVLKYDPQIESQEGNIVLVKDEWVEYSGIYRANGGEQYMTIGNFKSINDTRFARLKFKLTKRIHFFAYYYVDDVQLKPIKDTSECFCSVLSKTLDNGYVNMTNISDDSINFAVKDDYFGDVIYDKPMTLENIYFDFDKYDLLPESYGELDTLYMMLARLKDVKVEIMGHTDSVGSSVHNIELSENRARSVVSYLVAKGVSPDVISYTGFGFLKPTNSNLTPEGRRLNRRVEFVLKKICYDQNY